MTKEILFADDARQKVKIGIDKLASCVSVTLGPKGRNVILEKKFGAPTVTKDGVSVAKEIVLEDAVENIGAQMVKEVASKTSDVAGDGTTTATVLAQAIYNQGLKNVTSGANPMDLKRGIDIAVSKVIKYLETISKKVENPKEIQQIGTISANNDPEIGKLISDAMEKVGKDGVITVEEAKGTKTEVVIVEGMQFDRGYISPYFVTNSEKMEAVLEDAFILLYDGKISVLKHILPTLEKVSQLQKPLVLIADEIENEVLTTLVVNKLKGFLRVAAVKSPGFGDRRKELLEDIAIITGGTVVSKEKGYDLESISMEMLGRAKKVNIDKDSTTIVEGNGDSEEISHRISEIKMQIETSKSDYDREKLQERLAKLSGGVAVLRIGAITEVEMKEKKDRIDDALHATRAAVEEGIVVGGGVALVRASMQLNETVGANADQTTGINIIKKALEEPFKQIIKNTGLSPEVILHSVKEGSDNYGFNASTEIFEDLMVSGVIDPTKVTRTALENAASISSLLLTTEAIVYSKKDDNEPQENMPMY